MQSLNFLMTIILAVTFLYCESVSHFMYDINNTNAPLNVPHLFEKTSNITHDDPATSGKTVLCKKFQIRDTKACLFSTWCKTLLSIFFCLSVQFQSIFLLPFCYFFQLWSFCPASIFGFVAICATNCCFIVKKFSCYKVVVVIVVPQRLY